MMKRVGWVVALALVLAGSRGGAQNLLRPRDEARRPVVDGEEAVTVITSDRLIYDGKERYALFERNVTVTDPRITLRADRLTAHFDQESQLTRIEAEGHVFVKQDDILAWAGEAVYDVVSGQVVLKKEPMVRRGRDTLQGGTITLWRDENRMTVEPGARLTIHPAPGDAPRLIGGGS
jgi:lipopolysaccharide transport protein LptA